MRQVHALTAADRVLVLGCSAAPHAAVKKDEVALLGLFDKHLPVPLPDYAARRVSYGAEGVGNVLGLTERKLLPAHALRLYASNDLGCVACRSAGRRRLQPL